MKKTRQEVYRVINQEREYQEQRWSRPAHNHSVTEYLVFIDHYVKQAMARVSVEDGEAGALPDIRKIAALAVACMEENGVAYRERGTGAAGLEERVSDEPRV